MNLSEFNSFLIHFGFPLLIFGSLVIQGAEGQAIVLIRQRGLMPRRAGRVFGFWLVQIGLTLLLGGLLFIELPRSWPPILALTPYLLYLIVMLFPLLILVVWLETIGLILVARDRLRARIALRDVSQAEQTSVSKEPLGKPIFAAPHSSPHDRS